MGENNRLRELATLIHTALYRRGGKKYRERVGEHRLSRPGSRQRKWDDLHLRMLWRVEDRITEIETHLWKSTGSADLPSAFAYYLSWLFDEWRELFLAHALSSKTGLTRQDLVDHGSEELDTIHATVGSRAHEGFRKGIHSWCAQLSGVPALLEACMSTGLPGLVVRVARFLATEPKRPARDLNERVRREADVAAYYQAAGFSPELRAGCDLEICRRAKHYFTTSFSSEEDYKPWYDSALLRIKLQTTPESAQHALNGCKEAKAALVGYYEERGMPKAGELASRGVLPSDVHFRTRLARMVLQARLGLGAPIKLSSPLYHRLMRINRQLLKMVVPYLEFVVWERGREEASTPDHDSDADIGHKGDSR